MLDSGIGEQLLFVDFPTDFPAVPLEYPPVRGTKVKIRLIY